MHLRRCLHRTCLVLALALLALIAFPVAAGTGDGGEDAAPGPASVISWLQGLWDLYGPGTVDDPAADPVAPETPPVPLEGVSTYEVEGEIGPDIDPNG